MQVESVSKKKYFVTFIDAHSKYTEVFFLREKSEVPKVAMEYIEKLKTQFGRKPKIFRTDRGTEYINERLQSYLSKEGIRYECTVGYAPEQNGIAERKNRTLVEAARSMITDSGLPKSLWAEAISTANYVFNRVVNVKTKMSPYEIMFHDKPKINNFVKFGCDAYVMIPYEKRRKLDDKAKKMKFVGYDENSKGYRFVNEHFKIIVSREYQFLESKHEIIQDKIGSDEDFGTFEVFLGHHDDAEEYFYDAQESDDEDGEIFLSDNDDVNEEENLIAQNNAQQPRRSIRENIGQPPVKFDDYVVYQAECADVYEPKTYNQAVKSTDANQWLSAMNEELTSIEQNETWELCNLPAVRKAIGSKWVFKLKMDENGKIIRHKARLVAQGFSQKFGVDYDEVFAPVVRTTTLRMLLSVAGARGYAVNHYDIKTAFLNGSLNEEIYMKPPPGFPKEGKVYRLRKSLKQL